MPTASRIIENLSHGVVLDVVIEELTFTAYVVISEADINLVADFVPASQFEKNGDVHVTAVDHAAGAREQVEDLAFNMNLHDTAVFMCADRQAYDVTLEELGQNAPEH